MIPSEVAEQMDELLAEVTRRVRTPPNESHVEGNGFVTWC